MNIKKNMKKIILIASAALILFALIFCLVPRTTVWEGNVRCYNLNGVDLSLSDDTGLEGMTDYIDLQCDFNVSGPLFPAALKGSSGTVKFNDTEYKLSSVNIETDNNWISMSLSGKEFEMNKQLYVSPNEKYILLFCPKELEKEESAAYWIGPCRNLEDLKTALKDFGLDYDI